MSSLYCDSKCLMWDLSNTFTIVEGRQWSLHLQRNLINNLISGEDIVRTVDCLRRKLLAERVASRNANEEAKRLGNNCYLAVFRLTDIQHVQTLAGIWHLDVTMHFSYKFK